MGALDKRLFSGVAIVSALLVIVSAAMLFVSDAALSADDNSTALYILTIAGILAIVYSASMFVSKPSFVRRITGVLLLVSGVLFIAVAFAGESAETLLAVAGLVAGITLVADMLALWVSHVYGAMYVSAILGAFDIGLGVMSLVNGYSATYCLVMLLVFAVWLVLSAWVTGFVTVESAPKTREVIEDTVAKKKDKPKAENKKATPKAKRPEPKPKEEAPKQDAPKEVERPADEAPEPRKVRTVELPKTAAAQAAIQKSQSKADEVPEAKEAPKQEQKSPSKSMGDFMERLMKSSDAAQVSRKEEPQPPVEEPVAETPVEEVPVEEIPAETPVESVEEPVEEVPVEEIPAETPVEETPDEISEGMPVEEPPVEEPFESVLSEPIEVKERETDLYVSVEPNWDTVKDSTAKGGSRLRSSRDAEEVPEGMPAEEPPAEEAPAEGVEGPVAEVPVEETPAEEVPVEETPVVDAPSEGPVPAENVREVDVAPEVSESVIREAIVEPVAEGPQFSEGGSIGPDWHIVSRDTSAPEPEEPPVEEPPVEEVPAEEAPVVEPKEEVPAEEPSVEEVPAEEPSVEEVPVTEPEDEVPQEDIYTDNSPEALVRRAAWNKGLRCRRGYGEWNIPVAFVKGKVAVYVDEGEPDTSNDEALRAEGWTVLRYRAEDITDGRSQGDEIAQVVKENTRTTKKRKSKK